MRATSTVVLLGGDGIGPAVLAEAVRAVGASGFAVRWSTPDEDDGPAAVAEHLRATGVALVGPGARPLITALGPGVLVRPLRAEGLDLQLVGPADDAAGLRAALL